MSIISSLTVQGEKDMPLWIGKVRRAFDNAENPIILRLCTAQNEIKDYRCPVVLPDNEAERGFLKKYIKARIFNILSVFSAVSMTAYCAPDNSELIGLINECFSEIRSENGYRKVISIVRRLNGSEPVFCCRSLEEFAEAERTDSGDTAAACDIMAAVKAAEGGVCCGIDVGGTDIKLAVSLDGKLLAVKEYDWNPSLAHRAGEIKAPVILLAKLMAAVAGNELAGRPIDLSAAVDKAADDDMMKQAIRDTEKRLGALPRFAAIGLSFPDIVIRDRIMGGETPKTIGIRNDPTADYESELVELSKLTDDLRELADTVKAVNDGAMAAFSSFCELGYAGKTHSGEAMIAHSLGTDLGTGWIDEAGSVPPYPTECYDLLFDLGSEHSTALPADDLRSLKNENSGMAGARRYLGQAAVFRLIYNTAPELISDFTCVENSMPQIRLTPVDLRKSCLAHIMQLAADGDPAAEDAFRKIGIHLGEISDEIEYITRAGIARRWLFGRFVKNNRCFELISEGFCSVIDNIELIAADEEMAFTPLMRQLAGRTDATVAQFAQAVSGIYYALYAR